MRRAGLTSVWFGMLCGLVGCPAGHDAGPEPSSAPAAVEFRFLGYAETQVRKLEDENPQIDSRLRGLTTMTKVQPSNYGKYRQLKRDGRLTAEEAHGGFIYFATEKTEHVPLSNQGNPNVADGAYIKVIERFRATLPAKGRQ